MCHSAQSKTSYLESLSTTNATLVNNSLESVVSLRKLNISNNYIDKQIATEIAIILSFISTIKEFYASNNNLLQENAITIIKGLQHISTFTVFNINNNTICEEAADNVATVLYMSKCLFTRIKH